MTLSTSHPEKTEIPDITLEREMLSQLAIDPEAFDEMPMAAIELEEPINGLRRVIICGIGQENVEKIIPPPVGTRRVAPEVVTVILNDATFDKVKVEIRNKTNILCNDGATRTSFLQEEPDPDSPNLFYGSTLKDCAPEVQLCKSISHEDQVAVSSEGFASSHSDYRVHFEHYDRIRDQVLATEDRQVLVADDVTLIIMPTRIRKNDGQDYSNLFPSPRFMKAILYVRDNELEPRAY